MEQRARLCVQPGDLHVTHTEWEATHVGVELKRRITGTWMGAQEIVNFLKEKGPQ